jgi:hypothetical protein
LSELPARPPEPRFFLDHCLPHQIADALGLVDYPITSALRLGMEEWKDPELIPRLAADGYIWVTKDDGAKTQHRTAILRHGLCVVWVRGLGRKKPTDTRKNAISIRQVFLMLAHGLPRVEHECVKLRVRWDYVTWMAGDRPRCEREDVLSRRRGSRRTRPGRSGSVSMPDSGATI